MASQKIIAAQLADLRATAQLMLDRATQLEHLLTGDGTAHKAAPVSTLRARKAAIRATVAANMAKARAKKIA